MPSLKLNDLRDVYDINSDEELNLLYWAYLFNMQHNIDNIFEQNLAKETSALLSIGFDADIDTVVASLIYRTVFKLNYSEEDIKNLFNEEIMKKVKLLNSCGNNLFDLSNDNKVEMLKTITNDVKIMIIKLVERVALLNNISDDVLTNYDKVVSDTLNFFIPISQLLGVYKIKNSLEDLCFRYDENYDETSIIVQKVRERNEKIIDYINTAFKNIKFPNNEDIKFVLNKKSNYDIYLKSLKLEEKVDTFQNESDLKISGFCSVRCLTKTREECYEMLSFIHGFKYQFGTFLDYISGFQGDEYRALHTKVFINSYLVDFRICTTEMDNINYYGITHDWKDKPNFQERLINNYQFYGTLIKVLNNSSNNEILNQFKENIIDECIDVNDYKYNEKQKKLK